MTLDPASSGGIEPFPDENTAFTALYDSQAFAEFEQSIDSMLEVLVGALVASGRAQCRGPQRPPTGGRELNEKEGEIRVLFGVQLTV